MPRATKRWYTRGLTAAVLVAALLLSGCIYNGWPFRKGLPEPELNRPDSGRAGESPGNALGVEGAGWKVVNGKREPCFLTSRDGTECTVSEKKWQATAVGTKAFCIWSKPGPRAP
jgi:hypothetical protein